MNLVVWVQVLWIFVFTASIMTMTSLITIGHVVISVRLGISPLFKYNITQNAYICLFSCVGFRVLSQIACSWLYEVAMIPVYCFFSPECDIMCNLKLLLSAIFWSHQMHLRGSPHDQLSRQIRTLKGERKIRPRPSPRPPCQPPRRQLGSSLMRSYLSIWMISRRRLSCDLWIGIRWYLAWRFPGHT